MTQDLRGQVALITGSTSGIGLGIAQALVAAGARVILNGIEPADQGTAIAATLGDAAIYLHGDLSRTAAVVDLMHDAMAAYGRLDILVNNAGIQHVAPLAEFPPEKYDLIIALNQSSVFHTTRLALPMMRKLGRGRIINIASAHGLVGSPFKSAYVAAKHAVVGLTKVTALETAEENITANAICPGYVLTPLVEAQIDAQAAAHGISRDAVIRDVLLAQQPNKKFATVAEIGAMTAFLASDAAASITGAALPVDGGWTAH
jgi:3-hydroxybutyrate dehydrogenase